MSYDEFSIQGVKQALKVKQITMVTYHIYLELLEGSLDFLGSIP